MDLIRVDSSLMELIRVITGPQRQQQASKKKNNPMNSWNLSKKPSQIVSLMNSRAMGIGDERAVRAIGLLTCGDDGLVEGDSEHHMPSSWTRV
jgi:hypothetical protein